MARIDIYENMGKIKVGSAESLLYATDINYTFIIL